MRAKLAIAAVGAGAAALAAYAAAIAYLRDRRWKSLVRTRDRPKLKIGYWAIRGLAAPLRMAAAYGGLKYESVEYELQAKPGGGWDRSEWMEKKPALVEKNALMNLPYIVDGDIVITQSNACLMYLGRKCGLAGLDEADGLAVEQCLCQLMDLRNDTTRTAYSPDALTGSPSKFELHLQKSVPVHFKKLNGFMEQRGTAYLCADTPTVADFHLFEMIDQACRLAKFLGKPSPLDGFDKIAAVYASIREEPRLAQYFASPQYALPQNNKSASYGGDRNDGR